MEAPHHAPRALSCSSRDRADVPAYPLGESRRSCASSRAPLPPPPPPRPSGRPRLLARDVPASAMPKAAAAAAHRQRRPRRRPRGVAFDVLASLPSQPAYGGGPAHSPVWGGCWKHHCTTNRVATRLWRCARPRCVRSGQKGARQGRLPWSRYGRPRGRISRAPPTSLEPATRSRGSGRHHGAGALGLGDRLLSPRPQVCWRPIFGLSGHIASSPSARQSLPQLAAGMDRGEPINLPSEERRRQREISASTRAPPMSWLLAATRPDGEWIVGVLPCCLVQGRRGR